jgi:preprotein translocase SecF subunit
MFNLTSKKYYFFGASLLIILPGLISLLFWRMPDSKSLINLNYGIDFTGGTTVDLHFPQALSSNTSGAISSAFATKAGAKDIHVYYAQQQQQSGTSGTQVFYLKFDRPIDSDFQAAIYNRFSSQQNVFGTVVRLNPLNGLKAPDGTLYSILPLQFSPPQKTTGGPAFTVTLDQVKKALNASPLPETGPVDLNSTATPTPTPAATTTTTPAATATASPKPTATASTTPTATATPAAGSGSNSGGSSTTKFPVKLLDVVQGATDQNQVVTVQSQTQLKASDLLAAESVLATNYHAVYESQVQSVSPTIGASTTTWSIIAVILASVAILLYIAFAFRNVGSLRTSLRYGACAIIALLHDALVVLGIWSILGHLFPNDFKVDTLFVTAILTVIGFSVHDTIVVFDRIRENSRRRSMESFVDIANASLLQTMARSLNTSLTVLITLSALVLFGGGSIRSFTLALLIGIFSGTYSSIFNASMLLVVWETGEWRTWFGRRQDSVGLTTRGATRVARAGTR